MKGWVQVGPRSLFMTLKQSCLPLNYELNYVLCSLNFRYCPHSLQNRILLDTLRDILLTLSNHHKYDAVVHPFVYVLAYLARLSPHFSASMLPAFW